MLSNILAAIRNVFAVPNLRALYVVDALTLMYLLKDAPKFPTVIMKAQSSRCVRSSDREISAADMKLMKNPLSPRQRL